MSTLSSRQAIGMRLWRLLPLAFPVMEVACFAAAVAFGPEQPLAALGMLALTAVMLCFALHITYHEWVHQGHPGGLAGELVISALIGLPLDGYRWHHLNHHRHENALEDYSTTWEPGPQRPVAQVWWRYVLGWPRQLVRSAKDMRERDRAGMLPPGLGARVRRQKRALGALFVTLLVVRWPVALAYLLTTYAGWALVSLHNFGQHPPVSYGDALATSYRGSLYNLVFCQNGLHHEHHRDPALPWDRLVPLEGAPLVERPHLLIPRPKGIAA